MKNNLDAVSDLLGKALSLCNWFSTLRDNRVVSCSGVEISKESVRDSCVAGITCYWDRMYTQNVTDGLYSVQDARWTV